MQAGAHKGGAAISVHGADGGVLGAIRTDLLSGRYGPNERLIEANLAQQYEAPKAAVRNALITLASEGLVDRERHRGARARPFTLREAIEVAEARRELETLCAAHAAQAATDAERRGIIGLVEDMRLAVAGNDPPGYQELSVRFHELVGQAAHHATAWGILAELRQYRLDLHFPAAFPPASPERSFPDHERIARLIVEGDDAAAARAMHDHVGIVVGLLVDYRDRRGS